MQGYEAHGKARRRVGGGVQVNRQITTGQWQFGLDVEDRQVVGSQATEVPQLEEQLDLDTFEQDTRRLEKWGQPVEAEDA